MKRIILGGFALIVCLSLCSKPINAQELILVNEKSVEFDKELRDDIQWRYKVEDGKLYRCLYNYTTQSWIGEWELC